MVFMCPKCGEKVGCHDEEEGNIYVCANCELKDRCDLERYELAKPVLCNKCKAKRDQLLIEFPE